MSAEPYATALRLIDEGHVQDPKTATTVDGKTVPYELYYAQRSTHYLTQRAPDASPVLQTAVRAQHFRRWELARSSFPPTRTGYLTWRTVLKRRQADLVRAICESSGVPADEAARVAALMRKEDLANDEETQVLEDVACLVFLELDFEAFDTRHEEDKIVDILRKTWGKMSDRGRELALGMQLSDRAKELVGKALAG